MREFINLITELFDSSTKLKWTTTSDQRDVYAEFALNDYRYFVRFAFLDEGTWECAFGLDLTYGRGLQIDALDATGLPDLMGILGTGNAARVYSNVFAAIEAFIPKYRPRLIAISAREPSRRKLYSRMVQFNNPKNRVAQNLAARLPMGYRAETEDDMIWIMSPNWPA